MSSKLSSMMLPGDNPASASNAAPKELKFANNVDNIGSTSAGSSRRPSEAQDEMTPEAREEIRRLAIAPQKSRLQEQRAAHFNYETFSLPTSRVCHTCPHRNLYRHTSCTDANCRFHPETAIRHKVPSTHMQEARYPVRCTHHLSRPATPRIRDPPPSRDSVTIQSHHRPLLRSNREAENYHSRSHRARSHRLATGCRTSSFACPSIRQILVNTVRPRLLAPAHKPRAVPPHPKRALVRRSSLVTSEATVVIL